MANINLWVRSAVFDIIMAVVTIFYSVLCVLSFPLPYRFRAFLISAWTSLMVRLAKIICRIDYRVEGLENIPKNRNGIVLSKHQSAWETFFLQSLFDQTAIILKRELLWIPFFGWGLATIEPIAINRSEKITAMEQIYQQGKKRLDQGRWVIVFPEGTRIKPGHVGKYRLGGARLATHTGYPILPVAHNAGHFWPKYGVKKPGVIQVVIGPLIETVDRKPEEVLQQVKNWIEETVKRLD